MITAVDSPAELVAVTRGDPLMRSMLRHGMAGAWRDGDGALAVAPLDAERRGVRGLMALGEPPAAAVLLATVLPELGTVPRVTLPRGGAEHLPFTLDEPDNWDFFATSSEPPAQPREAEATWLTDDTAEELRVLLDVAGPGTATRPGNGRVRRWAGIRDETGRILCCLADTSGDADVAHLSAVATHPDARGRGLGAAVTAWATRKFFAERYDTVTLGMYAENDRARRVYERLGFLVHHRMTSGVPAIPDSGDPDSEDSGGIASA